MKRQTNVTLMMATALLVVGCTGQKEEKRPAVKVRTQKVEPVAVGEGRTYSGTVEETMGTSLSFAVAGTVTKMCVGEGQRISKGQLVATLDEVTLRDAHSAAKAALEQAEDAFRRMKQLHDNGSLPEIQWVEVQSKLRQAQSAESMARKSLNDGRLYAPFTGVIAEKNCEAGQNVVPGMQVARLVDVSQVKVCIAVPESEIAHMVIGQEATVSVAALGGRTFEARITEKGVTANSLSRTYNVKATVNNRDGALLPGMAGDLRLTFGTHTVSIMLPQHAIQIDEHNHTFVWVAADGTAHKRSVSISELLPEGVVITKGLAEGDMVIVEGQQKVSEGMEVKML